MAFDYLKNGLTFIDVPAQCPGVSVGIRYRQEECIGPCIINLGQRAALS